MTKLGKKVLLRKNKSRKQLFFCGSISEKKSCNSIFVGKTLFFSQKRPHENSTLYIVGICQRKIKNLILQANCPSSVKSAPADAAYTDRDSLRCICADLATQQPTMRTAAP